MVCAICRGGMPPRSLGYALSLASRATDDAGRPEVVKQLRRAAEAQLPTAIYLLGDVTDSGLGVPRDPAAAAQLYRDAAEKGHRSAQVRWGLKLLEGQDVEQDRVTGESWLRRAALAGDPEAAPLVGNLYAQVGPCRRTMPRQRIGTAAPLRADMEEPPGRWHRFI